MDIFLYTAIIIFCASGTISHIAHLWVLRIDETLRENIRTLHSNMAGHDKAIDTRDRYIEHMQTMLYKDAEAQASKESSKS